MLNNKRFILHTIIALVIAAIVGGIAYMVYTSHERAGKTEVTLVVAPNDADVALTNTSSGKVTKSRNGTVYLEPGTYDVLVEKKGFTTYKTTRDTTKDNTIIAELAPETEEAIAWTKKHRDQFQKLEGIADKRATAYNRALIEKHPLLKVMPIKDPYYSIGYYQKDGEPIIVISTQSPQYRYVATRRINRMGYKISDYRIEYKDFQNPLEAQKQ